MKILIAIISSVILIVQPVFAEAHLKEARSPLMTAAPAEVAKVMTTASTSELEKGVWIPNSYGGITGVQLDLDQVGSNNMLCVRNVASRTGELRPYTGEHYKLHSDVTIKDEKSKQTIRTVILIDQWRLKESGNRARDVICYKVVFQRKTQGSAEQTHYSLTFTSIADEYEVRFLIPFRASFPSREHPNISKPTQREQAAPSNR